MSDNVQFIANINHAKEVDHLPKGAIVGDQVGGRSFSDNVAAALERRSYRGWRDVADGDSVWTVIVVER